MSGLEALLTSPRFEVIPGKGTEQAVAEWVPAGMTVTVTASPVKGLEPTIELAEKLAGRGYRVVPHLAARSVASDAHLAEIRTVSGLASSNLLTISEAEGWQVTSRSDRASTKASATGC